MKKLCVLVFTILLVIALVHGVSGEELAGDITAEAIELIVPETEEALPVGDDADAFGEFDDFRRNVAAAEAGNVVINSTSFPDIHFREYVLEFDMNGDGILSGKECAAVKEMAIYPSNNIIEMKGIEWFTNLEKLICNGDKIAILDVSGNTMLRELECRGENLKSLQLGKNTKLTELNCIDAQLTSLDVSGCKMLTSLYCDENKLVRLNVSGCTMLTDLSCDNNRLTSLDVSSCTALTKLGCSGNKLTNLDVSGCTNLMVLNCDQNRLKQLKLSKNPKLYSLHCENNKLMSLDLSKNINLAWFECYGNRIQCLDFSNCKYLLTADWNDIGKEKTHYYFTCVKEGEGLTGWISVDFSTWVIASGKALYSTLPKSLTLGAKDEFLPMLFEISSSSAKSIKFISSNKKIAKVDSKTGKITAIKAGTATINAKFGSKAVAKCRVTVKNAPKKVTLNKSKVTLKKGKTCQLKATLPSGTYTSKLTWTSSNKKVAKVSSKGKVTAVGKGTATITVKTAGGVKATCKVTVKAPKKRLELSQFFGVKFSKVEKALGIKAGMSNGKIQLGSWGEPAGPDYVELIEISSDPKGEYMIYGVYLGMKLSEADKLLRSQGWYIPDYSDNYINEKNGRYRILTIRTNGDNKISYLFGELYGAGI